MNNIAVGSPLNSARLERRLLSIFWPENFHETVFFFLGYFDDGIIDAAKLMFCGLAVNNGKKGNISQWPAKSLCN